MAELAQQYDVHPNQIQDWKKRVLSSAEQLFENGYHGTEGADQKIRELHEKIGELTMDRDFLSKALETDERTPSAD